ncbi:MAG: EamA family transporter [Betaproteobacteria bacterium]|nr:EamA family transporter [Betaproteobacteria bacterium]MDE2343190.1 EamA family transporter [Betaproteobacteria bacterium]MDE2622477.1 EamA family transporter [Betaproteobacteria bacterium]
MSPASFSLILTGVLLNAAAQLLLKAGTNAIGHFEFQWRNLVPIGWQVATEPHILGGLACYAISVVVWIMALSRVPVSMAYPMLSIGYVVNAVAAYWLLGESLPAVRVAGIFVVILGVFLIARS